MKGQENLIPVNERTKDVQREIRSKGGKARAKKIRERKTIAEALRQVLEEPIAKGSKQTKLDGISLGAIANLLQDPNIKDVKVLAEILGELKQTISAEGLSLTITSSDTGKDNINKILEG